MDEIIFPLLSLIAFSVPTGQDWQVMDPALEKVLLGHGMHEDPVKALKVPASQLIHCELPVNPFVSFPNGQLIHWLEPKREYLLMGQAMHAIWSGTFW